MSQASRSYGTVQYVQIEGQPPARLIHRRDRRRRNTCSCPCCCCLAVTIVASSIFILLLCFTFAFWTLWGVSSTSPPIKPDYSSQHFAVGFDLSTNYVTAAVSYPNGTTRDLLQADASTKYYDLMAHLSLESSRHPTPPYYSRGNGADVPRQLHRILRKKVGLPASKDVATLVDLLVPLKTTTEAEIGPFKYVFVTVPHLPAMYNQDLVEACEYLDLQMLTLPWYVFRSGDAAQWPVTHVNTAIAGMNFGLCPDVRNHSNCGFPPDYDGKDDILSVLYTSGALTAHVSPIWNPIHYYAATGIANFSLGYSNAGSDSYWLTVRAALGNALDSYYNRGHELGRVFLHGDGTKHEPKFIQVLKEEVTKAQLNKTMPALFSKDPVYAAARGAAEFGKRCMLDPGLDCIPDLTPKPMGW